jgi:hypothetical protein
MDSGRPVLQADRERAMWRIRAAVDDGVLDLAEAGRRLLAVHHAETQGELRGLLTGLEQGDVVDRSDRGRRALRWAAVVAVLLAALAVVLLLSTVPGLGPFDVS